MNHIFCAVTVDHVFVAKMHRTVVAIATKRKCHLCLSVKITKNTFLEQILSP